MLLVRCAIAVCLIIAGPPRPLSGDDHHTGSGDFNTAVDAAFADSVPAGLVRLPIGLTHGGTRLWGLAEADALNVLSDRQRVLILGGLDGSPNSVAGALALLTSVCEQKNREAVVACVPIANPDGWAMKQGQRNSSGGSVNAGYPPEGTAYNTPQNSEAHALWRFIGWFAPDVVIEVHDETAAEWQAFVGNTSQADSLWPSDCLAYQVRQTPVAGIGSARAVRFVATDQRNTGHTAPQSMAVRSLGKLTFPEGSPVLITDGVYSRGGGTSIQAGERSELRQTMIHRQQRPPIEVAQQLAKHYGDHLNTVMYQPALALVARLRLSELTGNESHRRDVAAIVRPYLDGSRQTLDEKVSGSHLAGHLVFAELARITGDERYVAMVKTAADFAFRDDGTPKEAMPFHNEMSDAVFMGCPILTAAGRFTGDDRYFEMADRHLQFMQGHCLRADGLYRHSPLCEAAWGRGNGFPALGVALCLADLDAIENQTPVIQALRRQMQASLLAHLRSLAKSQDVTGMWLQVIDDPGSYRELTATCMITYAMVKGIRSGWIEAAEFRPIVKQAWDAITIRIGDDGTLFDVCTGTGKQKSLQDYRDRTAILGKDERGGAMALMAAVEMAAWAAETASGEPAP